MKRALAVTAAILAAIQPGSALAQDYPSKPMRMIIPFGVGGDTDILGRLIADRLSKQFGQAVVPENRPGGAGLIAAQAVARAPADGHMLLFANTSLFVSPAMTRNLTFEPQNDFTPVATIGRTPWALMGSAEFPARTIAELLATVRANPGKYSYSSGGSGSTSHLSFELIKNAANLDIVHIPYKGGGDGNLAVLRNEVQLTLNNSSFAKTHPGKVNLIAMTGDERSPTDPDTPTLREGGVNVSAYVWMGVVAAAKTPRPIIDRLNRTINDAVMSPEVAAIVNKKLGYETSRQTPEQVGAFMASEFTKWAAAVKAAGIKPTD